MAERIGNLSNNLSSKTLPAIEGQLRIVDYSLRKSGFGIIGAQSGRDVLKHLLTAYHNVGARKDQQNLSLDLLKTMAAILIEKPDAAGDSKYPQRVFAAAAKRSDAIGDYAREILPRLDAQPDPVAALSREAMRELTQPGPGLDTCPNPLLAAAGDTGIHIESAKLDPSRIPKDFTGLVRLARIASDETSKPVLRLPVSLECVAYIDAAPSQMTDSLNGVGPLQTATFLVMAAENLHQRMNRQAATHVETIFGAALKIIRRNPRVLSGWKHAIEVADQFGASSGSLGRFGRDAAIELYLLEASAARLVGAHVASAFSASEPRFGPQG